MALEQPEQPDIKGNRRYASQSVTEDLFDKGGQTIPQTIKKVTIILPVHNEVDAIEKVCLECLEVLTTAGFEPTVFCVDDGSTDGSDKILKKLSKRRRQISYIRFSRNFGKEAAILAGIQEAPEGFHAIACMDSDGQHDPGDLVRLLKASNRSGYEIICGTRKSRAYQSSLKSWLANRFYSLFNTITGEKIEPGVGDFNLFRPKAVKALKELKEHHIFMKGLVSWIGFQREMVPVTIRPRQGGEAKLTTSRLLKLAAGAFVSFSSVPLRLWSFIGLCSAFLAIVYLIFVVFQTITFGRDVPGYATLVVLILGLGGIQLFSIGILGEYVGRIYDASKNRPRYIIEHRSREK